MEGNIYGVHRLTQQMRRVTISNEITFGQIGDNFHASKIDIELYVTKGNCTGLAKVGSPRLLVFTIDLIKHPRMFSPPAQLRSKRSTVVLTIMTFMNIGTVYL